jgi:DNA polymerase I-like protein with 3'-5' exonuclease and polymerase domains
LKHPFTGMFWAEKPGEKREIPRPMPPIPETGWQTPRDFPNLDAAEYLAFDTETYDPELLDHGPGWARGKSSLVGLSIATPEGFSWYFPCGHTVEPEYNLDKEKVLRFASHSLGNPRQAKVGANLMYDVGTLKAEGVDVAGELVDIEFAEALLSEDAEVNLEALGLKYLNEGKESSILYDWCSRFYGGSPNGTQRKNIYRSPARLVGPYAQSDAILPLRIIREQFKELQAQGLVDLFRMECALIPLLIKMRFAGVSVDIPKAEALGHELGLQIEAKKLKLFSEYKIINVNSAKELASAFTRLGFKFRTLESGAPTFAQKALESYDNPVAKAVTEIRALEKIKGTFIESYLLESHVNGKVHGQFNPLRSDEGGTGYGRFSASKPNLQNIPVRSDLGKQIRDLFIPDKGHPYWRKYDYSQIEYRMLIHFAVGPGSEEARAMFNQNPNMDYHNWALDMIAPIANWDISTPELYKKARKPIKNINFGLVFGMGKDHLAESIHKTLKEAIPLFDAYHKGVPFVKPTMAYYSQLAEEQGYISTLLGRRARFNQWEPSWKLTKAEREKLLPLPLNQAVRMYGPKIKRAYTYRATNNEFQGSAADLLKMAMYQCYYSGVFDYIGVPRLTVHDELDFNDEGGKDEGFREMRRTMETAIPLRIPVIAECDRGTSWGNVEAFKD